MNPTHHAPPDLIASYATGQLPMAAELALAAHLAVCPSCVRQVREIEAAEGRLMAALPDAAMTSGALARALAGLSGEPVDRRPVEALSERFGTSLPVAVAEVGFHRRRWLKPGFWAARARTPMAEDWRLVLLRAPAGEGLPAHRRTGDEFIAVLSGAFRDEETFAAGDFTAGARGHEHQLTVTRDGPCACLVAYRSRPRWQGLSSLAATWLGL